MKLSQFKFTLPQDQIAQYPIPYRDDARLLVLHRKSGKIEHKQVKDLVEYFDEGDVFVLNDTSVFPARLYASKEKTMARIEVFLLRELSHENKYWDVLVDPARKIRIGNKLFFGEDDSIVAEVIDNTTSRGRTLRFLTDYEPDEFVDKLFALGEPPLPKYIRRPADAKTLAYYQEYFGLQDDEEGNAKLASLIHEDDAKRYQAEFANPDKVGAVAAPATSLHFSKTLLKRLEIQGINLTYLTDHVNLGHFKPVDVEDLTKHKVESEQVIISEQTAEVINQAKSQFKRICAVGSEVIRALETVAGSHGQISAFDGWTHKFIYPPYEYTSCNAFMANLYMPQSLQLMMVCAFAGHEYTMAAYAEAVKKGYRFGDYGDAMLIVD